MFQNNILTGKNEVNTERQFEFDMAKAVCILGMVFVHCFEMLPLTESAYAGSLYYTFVIVLDALFGAGTFMICLGVGLTYTRHNKPKDYIKRGVKIFLIGYLLNVLRYVIPSSLYYFTDDASVITQYLFDCLLYTDIMQFAGLSFILFGLLKKTELPDWGIAILAFAMSVVGSFVRFIDFGSTWINELLGLFVAAKDDNVIFPYFAPFAVLNWFILVVFGYFFGKAIRRCENTEKFYAITTPVSAVVVITYMVVAIPNKYGMMCGDEIFYFQMTTLDAFVIMMGAVFIFGMYHYLLKIMNNKAKTFISGLSVNINKTYCIHWIIIGWSSVILWIFFANGIENYVVLLISAFIYVISSFLAELIRRKKDTKKKMCNYE